MYTNFTWYLRFHVGDPTIFSQAQRSLKIYSIILSSIWRHLGRVHFHRFRKLTSARGHYLPQSDKSHVKCEATKLGETVTSYAWQLIRLTTTGKHWFRKPSWIHDPLKQSFPRSDSVCVCVWCVCVCVYKQPFWWGIIITLVIINHNTWSHIHRRHYRIHR